MGLRLCLLALLLATSASATAVELRSSLPDQVDGDGELPYIGFLVADDTIAVDVEQLDANTSLDIVVMVGTERAPEPAEWYVIHAGHNNTAVDFEGEVLKVTQNSTQWRIDRIGGSAGDCIVVTGHMWQRVDDEKQVLASIGLSDPVAAWDGGEACLDHLDGTRITAGEPPQHVDDIEPGKRSPLGLPLVVSALALALLVRRR